MQAQVGLITGNLKFQPAALILLSRKRGRLLRPGRERDKGRNIRGLKKLRVIYLIVMVPPTQQAPKHLWIESMNKLTDDNGSTPDKDK